MPGDQVMFPVQVPDTKVAGSLKNVDCSPKAKIGVMWSVALCDQMCRHHRVSANGSGKQSIILPCLVMMSEPFKIICQKVLWLNVKALVQHFLSSGKSKKSSFPTKWACLHRCMDLALSDTSSPSMVLQLCHYQAGRPPVPPRLIISSCEISPSRNSTVGFRWTQTWFKNSFGC